MAYLIKTDENGNGSWKGLGIGEIQTFKKRKRAGRPKKSRAELAVTKLSKIARSIKAQRRKGATKLKRQAKKTKRQAKEESQRAIAKIQKAGVRATKQRKTATTKALYQISAKEKKLKKDLRKLHKSLKKIKKSKYQVGVRGEVQRVEKHLRVKKGTGVISGAVRTSKKRMRQEKSFRRGGKRLMTSMFGGGTSEVRSSRRAGRPKGTYKYMIPGKGAVGVYEYRRWLAKQKALDRMQQARQPPQQQQDRESGPSNTVIEQPQRSPYPQSPEGPAQRPNILQVREMNPLNATNVFAKDYIPQRMNEHEYQNPDDVQRPIANPLGEYYTEIDPATGRTTLHRRVQEKWLSGKSNRR